MRTTIEEIVAAEDKAALRDAPPQIAQAAADSIGAAATIAARLGPQGRGLLEATRSAFIQGMGDALQVGAGVATLAALLVLLFLPARATGSTEGASVPGVQIETGEVAGRGELAMVGLRTPGIDGDYGRRGKDRTVVLVGAGETLGVQAHHPVPNTAGPHRSTMVTLR